MQEQLKVVRDKMEAKTNDKKGIVRLIDIVQSYNISNSATFSRCESVEMNLKKAESLKRKFDLIDYNEVADDRVKMEN